VVCGKQKSGAFAPLFRSPSLNLDVHNDVGEDVTDCRPKQSQDDDNNYSDQYQNQSVFNKALTLFTWLVDHDDASY
jgi:hypothetical protein